MPRYDQPRENQAPRERISTLNAAILRISATLDVHTVLGEVVQCARDLTSARYGVIATVDESGTPRDAVFSGFTPAEEQDLAAWPDRGRLFDHLRDLQGPRRLTDLSAYVQGLGIVPAPTFSRTFQGTPMRHMGADVGNFFLADKADGEEFTDHDEEILVLFAAQAAAAIANARAHRREQRARADLEALVETSPVGVVVFDGRSGEPVSFNREARRIVESLRTPGHPPEQLLEIVTCRRADGREVSLKEFPLARQFGAPETVRSEEVELSVPDGRSVRTLINVTPIPGGGDATSVVATMQDLAPLDQAERLRTEFLALVSHELRQPLTSIKGSAVTLLEESDGLDRAEMHEFHRIIAEQADHMRHLVGDLLDAGRIEAGTLSVAPEPATCSPMPPGTPPCRPRYASRRRSTMAMSRCRSRMRVSAWRRSFSRICSASTAQPGNRHWGTTGWGWRSARGWWRRTVVESARKAQASAGGRRLCSRFPWEESRSRRWATHPQVRQR